MGIINIIVFVGVFFIAELSYRAYRGGVASVILSIKNYLNDVPYSSLGTGNWVIYDEQLGYRLNSINPGINGLFIRHGEIMTPKPPELYRVLVVGDSIPWDKSGFVSYLEEMLSTKGSIEVINGSVPGYTAYQEVLFFKMFLYQTEPDLVIWTYCMNDNHRFLHRFDEKARMLWTDEALESLKATSPFDKVVSRSYILSELKLRIMALQKQESECRFPWECVPDFSIAWKDESWALYEASVAEMKRLAEKSHSRLAIVVFPYEPQLDHAGLASDTDYVLKPQKQIDLLCQKYELPCLDVFPAFYKQKESSIKLFRDGIHLTKEGHELTAGLIYRFLQEKDLLPLAPTPPHVPDVPQKAR